MNNFLSKYGNFQNPISLAVRMIRSGNRAARFTLIREALGILFTPFDLMLSSYEKQRITECHSSSLPIILIVGSSRSGTTLLYQVLSQYLPVTYFNNFSGLFPRSPITACSLFNRFLRGKKGDFSNYFGNTEGFAGPNDGFHIWNRWLGDNRYEAPKELNTEDKRNIKKFFNAWLYIFKKPLLNKNNRNLDCMSLFSTIFDNIYFIVCRRNPLFIAQSLLISRLKVQGDKSIGWGVYGKDSDPKEGDLGCIDDICHQVHKVDLRLQEEIQRIDKDRVIEVVYEKFCEEPGSTILNVSKSIFGTVPDCGDHRIMKPFIPTNQVRIGVHEFQEIRSRICDLFSTSVFEKEIIQNYN